MGMIGGHIAPKQSKNYTYRITVASSDGSRTMLNFFTLRSARNYLREHPTVNAVELLDLRTHTHLDI